VVLGRTRWKSGMGAVTNFPFSGSKTCHREVVFLQPQNVDARGGTFNNVGQLNVDQRCFYDFANLPELSDPAFLLDASRNVGCIDPPHEIPLENFYLTTDLSAVNVRSPQFRLHIAVWQKPDGGERIVCRKCYIQTSAEDYKKEEDKHHRARDPYVAQLLGVTAGSRVLYFNLSPGCSVRSFSELMLRESKRTYFRMMKQLEELVMVIDRLFKEEGRFIIWRHQFTERDQDWFYAWRRNSFRSQWKLILVHWEEGTEAAASADPFVDLMNHMRRDLLDHPAFGQKTRAWVKYWNKRHSKDRRISLQ